jgi:hypothetical protein
MDKNKSPKTDEDIVREFESLFNSAPEPSTNEELAEILYDAGYDLEALKAKGLEFVNNLIANNWRFVTSDEIDKAATKINKMPIRDGWDRNHLLGAIQKISKALASGGGDPVLAFRNLEKLTNGDLASVLQELEYEANAKGIELDLN